MGIGIVVVLLISSAYVVLQFNRLRRLDVAVDEALSQIDVQLKRRADLVPNLVESVKGYAAHERSTFERVTNARAISQTAGTLSEKVEADGALTHALRGLLAVAESYPELEASANFLQLQEELSTTENKIGFARQYYNDTVRTLNTATKTFPGSLFTSLAGVRSRDFYEIDDPEARQNPKLSF